MTANLKRLIQLVPELPPDIGGVGDYALGLARTLRKNHGIESVFVALGSSLSRSGELEGFRVIALEKRGSAYLAEALTGLANAGSAVLVQYVGYGFDKNGTPTWLISGLELWRRNAAAHPLVTMFHELYATSWPWRRAFWFSWQQRNLAARLARMSDACAATLQSAARVVRKWRVGRGGEPAYVAAVPSNVGEPAIVPPLADREPSMVVFGTSASRQRVYRFAQHDLARSCELLGIKEVIDIGPGEITSVALPASVAFRRMGTLDHESVSARLLRCRAGFLDYPAEYLEKSGIFAAYCAHGMLSVLGRARPSGPERIVLARHYWHPGLESPEFMRTQTIATEAYAWYHGHDFEKHAAALARVLDRLPS